MHTGGIELNTELLSSTQPCMTEDSPAALGPVHAIPAMAGITQPIRNLQTYLRTISQYNGAISPVIPDGIYGPQTEQAVRAFQIDSHLPETGVVDEQTWDEILAAFDAITLLQSAPLSLAIFPNSGYTIAPGARSIHLLVIQAVLLSPCRRFSNLGRMRVSGVHDAASVATVQRLQRMFDLEPNGVIDSTTWAYIAHLYRAFISRDYIGQAAAAER